MAEVDVEVHDPRRPSEPTTYEVCVNQDAPANIISRYRVAWHFVEVAADEDSKGVTTRFAERETGGAHEDCGMGLVDAAERLLTDVWSVKRVEDKNGHLLAEIVRQRGEADA